MSPVQPAPTVPRKRVRSGHRTFTTYLLCLLGLAACGEADAPVSLVSGVSGMGELAASLTVTPITWNVIGLDSNNVNVGPDVFPVGVRVGNNGDATATGVDVTFAFTSDNPYINLNSPGTLTIPSLEAGTFADVYFEVAITRQPAAYDTTRRYVITASAAGTSSVSTPTPRELYVERLVSQNRNQITGINGPAIVNLGDTVTYDLYGSTATNGYEQLVGLLNFPASMFQVISTSTSYQTPASATNDKIYADACGWQSDPTLAKYKDCVGPTQYGGKAGGKVHTVYTVKAIHVGSASVTSLIYDFSGSSYHYNSDYSLTVRNIIVVDPTAPIANDDSYTTSQDTVLVVPAPGVLANDSDPQGDRLTANRVTGPSNGVLVLNADGFFTYTPNAGFIGSDTFTYTVNDGTQDSAPATVTLRVDGVIDTAPPDTFIDSGPPALSNSPSATFDFSSDKSPVTYECSLDGGAYAPCTDPVTFPGLADGPHTLEVRARDTAGNVDLTPATYSWVIDTVPPDTFIDSGPTEKTYSPSATFDFSSDKSPVTYECSLDGGAYARCMDPETFPDLADGPHTLEVRAKDSAGNVDPTPATYSWEVRSFMVTGSGCSASGARSGSSLWLSLGLLGLFCRRRARRFTGQAVHALSVLGCIVALVASLPGWAQGSTTSLSTAIDVQQFKVAPGEADVLAVHGSGVPGHLQWRAGFFLNYANDPLVVIDRSDHTLVSRLVGSQVGFDLIGAIGIGGRFEVGAVLPFSLQHGVTTLQTPGELASTWAGGLGDIRLIPKVLLFEQQSLRFGLVVPLVLPTGGAASFRGQAGLGAQPRIIADYALGGVRVNVNLGVNLRSRQQLLNLSVGNELAYGLGAAIPFSVQQHRLEGIASVVGAVGLGVSGGAGGEEAPLEVQGAIRYHILDNLMATVGLGRGVIRGYGMPNFRVLGGLVWTEKARPAPPPVRDSDGDGILDPDDKCPSAPEDQDGFEDGDGCPDLDNSQDGIPDVQDQCPNEAEDQDGFQDGDGCPDPDNDQDGIPDVEDRCPLKPEDKDGFQDGDGCPDPDNDRDGITDVKDQCPNEAEVINNVEDDDGCPDEGVSHVRVQEGKILVLEKVHFATGKDVILARSFPLLQQVNAVLRTNPQIKKVRIEGHTDSRGNDQSNLDLSQRRANNVRKYLVENGIAAERLEAVGYGETRPVDTNDTAAGRENNRRVVFTILEVAEDIEDV